jgi:tetratricopeptide (TPR) repeat protein
MSSWPESSIGEQSVNNCLKLMLLILLVKPVSGLGQQPPASSFESLVAAAQQAQAANDYAAAANDYAQAVKIRADIPELWANLGLMDQEAGDLHGATRSFLEAHRLNPSLYVPNLFLGIDALRANQAKEAIPFLMKAEKSNQVDPQPSLELGRAYVAVRDYSSAVAALTRSIHRNPKLGLAWFTLGIARLDQVEAEARRMSTEAPDSPYAKALFAESLDKQARYQEAAKLYREVLLSKKQPPCIHSELGFSLLGQHDAAGAAAEFSVERAENPQCGQAVLGQTRMAIDGGAEEQAVKLLHDLWKSDHGFVTSSVARSFDGVSSDHISVFLGYLAQRRDELPTDLYSALVAAASNGTAPESAESSAAQFARSELETGSSNAPRLSAEAYYASGEFQWCASRASQSPTAGREDKLLLLATCSFFTGDYEQSSRAAASLAVLQPKSVEALYWSIAANERLAFQSLTRFEELEPNSAKSHILLGDLYRQRERFDDAQNQYERALRIAPDDPAALLGLASAYLANNELDKAIEAERLALAHNPDDPELNLVMAEAMVAQHNYAGAGPFLDKSLHAKLQMLPHVHALMGEVYAGTGRTQDAIDQFRMGLSSDEDGSIHYQLARLYRQIGDSKSASEALEQMRIIKEQRRARGMRIVDDSDSSPSEAASR